MQARNEGTISRTPAVAGRFYPASATECRRQAESFLEVAPDNEKPWIGGVVPHAGWICSGAIAGQTIATLAWQQRPVDVVVVFGAIHTPVHVPFAALDSHARWTLPGGEAEVPLELQAKLAENADLFAVDERLHRDEHAVEVEVPLIQLAFPGAAVLPIETPPIESAEAMGRGVARVIRESNLNAVYLASSDLTHYGPNYGFAPVGVGEEAMRWSKENDRRLLDLVEGMRIEGIVSEAKQRRSACGAGAIAAMMAACREHGATVGRVLRHATSYETLAAVHPQPPTNAVGYASVVVG
jgi:hypothetical protein